MMGCFEVTKKMNYSRNLNVCLIIHVSSKKQVMVVDIQGAGYNLFDPEIASAVLVDKQEIMFTVGNLSQIAIDNFISSHTCNMFCKCLNLDPLR